jgi:hypothetical protein
MGLWNGLDPKYASELADAGIEEMRVLVVGELDGGIPEAEGQSEVSATPTSYKFRDYSHKRKRLRVGTRRICVCFVG